MLIVHNNPNSPLQLWDKFKDDFAYDIYLKYHNENFEFDFTD